MLSFGSLLLLVGCLLSIAACGPAEPGSRAMIVGGTLLDPAQPAASSMVAIAAQPTPDNPTPVAFCSGTLIAPRLIITAAHCIKDESGPLDVIFASSAHDPERIRRAVVASARYSPDALRFYPNNDIAWLRIEADAPPPFTPIEILRDPERLIGQLEGRLPLLIAGFGKTSTLCEAGRALCFGDAREVQTRLRRYVHTPHFRHLLLTGPTPGQGSCNGDSGGPAYARVDGRWYLVGVLHGKNYLLNSKQVLKPEQICESGESTYAFAGAYRDWLQDTSGSELPLDAIANPPGTLPPPRTVLSSVPTLAEYLAYDVPGSDIWLTAAALLNGFKEAGKRVDPNFDELVTDPERAAAAMLRWESFSANGVASNLPSLTLRDQQLSEVKAVGLLSRLKKLELSDHRIRETYPLAQLHDLEELKLSNNYDFVTHEGIPWDLSFLSLLPRLRILNLTDNSNSLELAAVPWAALVKLDTLILSGNAGAIDLNEVPWELLKGLKHLVIMNSDLRDIEPLARAAHLEQLNLRRNLIRDISVLQKLKELKILDVSENRIEDFRPVTSFDQLEKLWAIGNPSLESPCPPGASCIYRNSGRSDDTVDLGSSLRSTRSGQRDTPLHPANRR